MKATLAAPRLSDRWEVRVQPRGNLRDGIGVWRNVRGSNRVSERCKNCGWNLKTEQSVAHDTLDGSLRSKENMGGDFPIVDEFDVALRRGEQQDCRGKNGMQRNAANEQCKFNTGGNRFQFVSTLNFDEQFKTRGGKVSLGRFRLQGSYCNRTHVARSSSKSTIPESMSWCPVVRCTIFGSGGRKAVESIHFQRNNGVFTHTKA